MRTKFLTSKEKEKGIRHHYISQGFNGTGYNFLGDTPIYLLAINFGASNIQLGYISSTIFITGMFLTLIPRLFSGMNMVKLQFWAWLLRGLVCLSYTALFFLEGQAAIYLILGTYTLFSIFRVAGIVIYQPLMKSLTTNRNKGTVLSKSALHFQWPLSIARVVSFIVTSIRQLTGVTGILMLQWVGVIFNTLAAFQIRKVPCRQNIEYTPGRNVFRILSEALRNREFRYCLFLNWTNTALMVTFGFIIPFLRREVVLSSNLVFLYTLGAGLASVSAGLYTQGFADRIGSRPIILGSNILLGICTGLWILTPPNLAVAFYFIFGFLTTFSLFINSVMTNRLVVRTMPDHDTMGYSTMTNFFAGIVSLIVGISAGTLADASGLAGTILPNAYSMTFIQAFIFVCLGFFFAYKIKDPGSLSPLQAAGIMFSLTNLTTYQRIGQIRKTEDPIEKKVLLMGLGVNKSNMAENEIKSFLLNPLSAEKEVAILSLFNNPRPKLLPLLIHEAEESYSYHRLKAIFALGGYPGKETERALLGLLEDSDPEVRSNAAKSLGRIKSCTSLEKVRDLAETSKGIWNHLNYTIALKHMDTEGRILKWVFKKEYSERGKTFVQTHYSLHARLQGFTPPLAEIFQSRNTAEGQGLHDFLDEARDDEGFLESHEDFLNWFKDKEFEKIWTRCRKLLTKKVCSPYYENLKAAIMGYPPGAASYDDTLAVVYVTYQLIKMDPKKGYIHFRD